MLYIVTESSIDVNNLFNINGLEYEKSVYIIEYASYESNAGVPENIYISLINRYNRSPLISGAKLSRFNDGVNPLSVGEIASIITKVVSDIITFKRRVLADGGTIEAEKCLQEEIDRIKAI